MIPSSPQESLGCSQGERERERAAITLGSHSAGYCALPKGWGEQAEGSGRETLSHNSYNSHYLLSTHHEPDALCVFSLFSVSVREA